MGAFARRRLSSPTCMGRSISTSWCGPSRSPLGLKVARACPLVFAVNALLDLGQALLQALDPERAHDLAVNSLELGLYPRLHAARRSAAGEDIWG